jgi:hypothetical protein
MLYESLYSLLSSTATALPFDVEFAHGRGSDINVFSSQNKSFLIWLSPMRKTASFPNQGNRMFSNYSVELAFYMKDDRDSSNSKVRDILETTDKIATKFLIDLNDKITDDYEEIFTDVEITGINQEAFIKGTAHVLTGHLVTFNIILPDNFVYCP